LIDLWIQGESEEDTEHTAGKTGALVIVKEDASKIDFTNKSKKEISLLQEKEDRFDS
jgi:hypothetical protein